MVIFSIVVPRDNVVLKSPSQIPARIQATPILCSRRKISLEGYTNTFSSLFTLQFQAGFRSRTHSSVKLMRHQTLNRFWQFRYKKQGWKWHGYIQISNVFSRISTFFTTFFTNTNSDSNILECECKTNSSNSNSHSDICSIWFQKNKIIKRQRLKYDHVYEYCRSKITYLSIIIIINKYIN